MLLFCLFALWVYVYLFKLNSLFAKMFAIMLYSPLEETDSYSFTIYNTYKDFIICGSEGKEMKENENKTDTSIYFLGVTIKHSSLAIFFLSNAHGQTTYI